MSPSPADTVLITGANRGIGLEYARQYAADGYRVLATTRHLQTAEALQALARQYPNLKLHSLDISSAEVIRLLATQLQTETIDILINNAGVYPESTFGRTDTQAWLTAFQINTLSTYLLAEAFLSHLQRARQPRLVAMTSKMGSIADNGSGSEYIYRSSKTALNMVVKSLAIDLKPSNISVVALHPGWVRTDMGGPNGLIDVQTSVAGLRQVIDRLDASLSGQFIAYDGQPIPW
ncbi:MAG TPA: SDR family oxidoreductase [Methylophilus sp.]